MKIPERLIEKYNVPVPRYTSYPPANYFHEDISVDDYIQSVEQSNVESPRNISFYVHIPFCSKLCHFCGCNTRFTNDKKIIREYIDALKKEIGMIKPLLDCSRKVSQIHWGGGTPNMLPVDIIQEVMQLFHNNFSFIDNPEIAIECHPAMLTEGYVKQLISAKFNRFSLGIQDFKKDVLDNVNREAPKVPVQEIVSWIRQYSGTHINFDFIYGLPFQNVASFSQTIEKALEIGPDRLVTFSYAHVPWIKKAQKILEKRGLPEAEEKLKMFLAAYKILTNGGYTPIGLDHFAKHSDDLSIALQDRKLHRNFQGYCTRETTGQVYAFGATGISQLESAYAQNEKDPDSYVTLINQGRFTVVKGYRLNRTEKIIRHVISEIMCNEYVSLKDTAAFFDVTEDEVIKSVDYSPSRFKGFIKDGLLHIDNGVFEVTSIGRFFIRNIASTFDPNLNKGGKHFSKAL